MVAQLHEYTHTPKNKNVHFPKIKFRVYELCLNRVIFFNGLKTEAHLPCVFCLTQAPMEFRTWCPTPSPCQSHYLLPVTESPHNRYPHSNCHFRSVPEPVPSRLRPSCEHSCGCHHGLPLEGSEEAAEISASTAALPPAAWPGFFLSAMASGW